jgi:hypothetical protein
VAGQAIFGPTPAVMPGVAVTAMAGLERPGPWAPAIFIGATLALRGGLSESGGTASFALGAANLDACPLRWRGSRFVVRPCVSALAGRLSVRGGDTDQPASVTRPFAATGVAVNASVGGTFEIVGRVGVGATWIRDSYEFGQMVFHRAGRVTASAGLGVGVRWP